MAYTQLKTTSAGKKFYLIQVSRGRGKSPYSMRWYVPEGLSSRTIEKELNKVALTFENDCNAGLVKTKAEEKAELKRIALENEKVKTVQQYGEQVFIPNKERDGIESKTIEYYEYALKNHVYPCIGEYPIKDVSSADLKKLIFSLSYKAGKRKGQPLGKSSTHCVYVALNQLFTMAYEDDTLDTNPMGKVKLPKKTKGEIKNEEIEFLTEEQLSIVLDCVNEDLDTAKNDREYKEAFWHRAFVILLMETGCRCGEICGLKWKAVDFDNNLIVIENNVVYTQKHGLEETSPKGKRKRTVPFSNTMVIDTLRAIQQEQLKRGRISAYCFPQYDLSKPILPNSVSKYMEKFEKRHQLNFHVHPHKFRHTLATRLEQNGTDIASISKICGHAQISTTVNMYVHSDIEHMRKGMSVLDNIIKIEEEKKAE